MMETNDQAGELFGRLEVYDENGASLHLASLWTEQPAVLVFVRHFG